MLPHPGRRINAAATARYLRGAARGGDARTTKPRAAALFRPREDRRRHAARGSARATLPEW